MARKAESEKLAFTVEEAAKLLSISRAHLYRLIFTGVIGTIRIGRSRRVTKNQLDRFLERSEKQDGA